MKEPFRLRVMTFNIHGGRPATGPVNLEAIAAEIRQAEPDLVGLQEVHRYLPPPCVFQNQPRQLRQSLGLELYFGRTLGLGPVGYGNAVLTRLPGTRFRTRSLPTTREFQGLEPRGIIEARVMLGSQPLRFLNTHLGLTTQQRRRQLEHLARQVNSQSEPTILVGDLNVTTKDPDLRLLWEAGLRDCASDEHLTFPAEAPRYRIDHLLAGPQFEVERCFVIETSVSDHRPMIADLRLRI